jgi:superfamily II DNA/RNA helicase
MLFSSLGLCDELIKAVVEQGCNRPTHFQSEAISSKLNNQDVMAVAQPGTGKTAAFSNAYLACNQALKKEEKFLVNNFSGSI